MEGRLSSGSVLNPSTEKLRSDSKLTGEKRTSMESEDDRENTCKRVKMRDLESVFLSEGIGTHSSQLFECQKIKDQVHSGKNEENSQITEEPASMASDAFQAATAGQTRLSPSENVAQLSLCHADTVVSPTVLNFQSHVADSPTRDVRAAIIPGTTSEVSLPTLKAKVCDSNPRNSRVIELDLNEGVSNSPEQNPFHPYKIPGHVKSRATSECGSSTGPAEENESFRMWNEMKRNGFLSSSHGPSSHGGIPIPKQRGRKKKNDVLKKKMEIAKREQINRFTKIAAPSGLLNGLNPGIINHVRNSKQVHSIIEALVRSQKHENGAQSRSVEHLKKGTNEKGTDPSNLHDLGACRSDFSFGNELENTLSGSRLTTEYLMSSSIHTNPFSLEPKGANGDLDIAEKRYHDETSGASHLTSDRDHELKLKLSSENISMSNESANQASVSSLSVKAATVASQWLELLYQDIRGRLAALRRSKKRVQAVIQTELPFLLSKEFSSNKENDQYSSQSSTDRSPDTVTPDIHRARWTTLFEQMEKSLSEEGKHLENWLNQVKEMQSQCEQGLQCVNWHGLQLLGRPEIDPRIKKENVDRELAVRAAAASIYSTCNFVAAKEDLSCC